MSCQKPNVYANPLVPYHRDIDKLYLVNYATAGTVRETCLLLRLLQPVRLGVQKSTDLLPMIFEQKKQQFRLLPINVVREQKRDELGLKETEVEDYRLVSLLMKNFTGKPLSGPAAEFKTADGEDSLRCDMQGLQVNLFPLKFALLIVPKPVVLRRYQDIEEIVVERPLRKRDTFTLRIRLPAGDLGEGDIELQNVPD
eukprot:2309425-Amphidinium_carterae.1